MATTTSTTNGDGAITDVEGVRLGHWTSRRLATGCTVVLTEAGVTPGFHGAGGAPGTIDTQLLRPENTVDVVHAVLITGGSAHGLAAAAGVRAALVDRGVGLPVTAEARPVPLVTGAVVFDQGLGSPTAFPGPEQGAMAVRRATAGAVAEGCVGAGTGCSVAKLDGRQLAWKGGLGTASLRHDSGLVVGAVAAVNAAGAIVDPVTGELVAGPRRSADGRAMRSAHAALFGKPLDAYYAEHAAAVDALLNTTVAVVATNARLDKAQATRLAIMADDGLAHAVRPAHTPIDGDSVFVLATGHHEADLGRAPVLLTLLGSMAASALARAIVRGVRQATPLAGLPAAAPSTARD
jgi:L-aminopeptidase/D-esterase-like protein